MSKGSKQHRLEGMQPTLVRLHYILKHHSAAGSGSQCPDLLQRTGLGESIRENPISQTILISARYLEQLG